MKLVDINTQKFFIGIEMRTNNKIEASENGNILKVWEKFFKDNLSEKINNKLSENIYAIYSDYESDHNGNYNFFLGYEVPESKPEDHFENLIFKKLQLGKYAVVSTSQGSMPDIIIAAWYKIWNMTPDDLGGQRAFKTDFEVYGESARDPKNSIIDIYLGLKN
ncbi:GyrI-like domain-containing protein [Silvanigrella aquatica]|uniref:AraC effector-binding domain-containing protein n=1 Tax=Silvanigrella aquatica TaxID=1915309 RepID=A0A1L4D192_9BACT|nr:GyrI-like domain-containing protein [Silvanigrella aquatica]APJ03973.1 hypothetical protein AXG55_08655 [Silvanigrella aquatica]